MSHKLHDLTTNVKYQFAEHGSVLKRAQKVKTMDVQIMKTYSRNGLYRAVDIFNHPLEYADLTRILGFRFLTQWSHREPNYKPVPQRNKIIAQMSEMVQQHSTEHTLKSNSLLMDLVDILLEYAPIEGNELLAQLRECGGVANENGPTESGPECTIYGDSQSVHNETISASVKKAAKYLVCNFKRPDKGINAERDPQLYQEAIREEWINAYPDKQCILNPVFDRLFADNAHFGMGFTVDTVFYHVCGWIETLTDKVIANTAMTRMCEELIEMQGYCSSGMLSHIVNAVQGLTDEPELQIKISDKDQVKTVLYAHLNKAIQACGDEDVIEGITDGGEKFLTFIRKEIDNYIDEWTMEYGDEFYREIAEVANQYTGVELFDIKRHQEEFEKYMNRGN